MLVIPEDYPSKLPPEAPSKVSPKGHPFEASSGNLSNPPARTTLLRSPFGACRVSPKDPSHLRSLPEALPNASFRRLCRNPCRTAFRRVPPVPEASPKPFLRKPPFDTPSKQTLRS